MDFITISGGGYDAALDPIGGGLRSLQRRGDAITTTSSPHERPGQWDGAVLAPWPNRIDGGHFRFRGDDHQLPVNEPDRNAALHGSAWSTTWNVVERDGHSVRLGTTLGPSPGYPWTIGIAVTYSVDHDGLSILADARNLGDRVAPFGFGFHPYLVAPGGDLDRCELTFAASTRLLTDDRLIPVGETGNQSTRYDFSTPRAVGDIELDTSFGSVTRGPDGVATLTLAGPDGAGSIGCSWDASFQWLQLCAPRPGGAGGLCRSIAVEPMTCPPNAFNSGIDVIELEPTDSWSGAIRLFARR